MYHGYIALMRVSATICTLDAAQVRAAGGCLKGTHTDPSAVITIASTPPATLKGSQTNFCLKISIPQRTSASFFNDTMDPVSIFGLIGTLASLVRTVNDALTEYQQSVDKRRNAFSTLKDIES